MPGCPSRQTKSQPPEDRLQMLRSCPLFQRIEVAELELILRAAHEQDVKRGGFYFQQSDPARCIYMIMQGRVKLVQAGALGRRMILHFVRPPELFGYAVAAGPRVYSASAQALEDSQALAWDAVTMDRLMLEHSAIALSILNRHRS
jgi:CRP-like cAMP-binding protein